MAKNKQKGKKQKNVFRVATKQSKQQKNKAKPVTSSLKQIKALKNLRVENLDQIFTPEVQKDAGSTSNSTAAQEPRQKTQVTPEAPRESVNVDGAAQLFSQL